MPDTGSCQVSLSVMLSAMIDSGYEPASCGSITAGASSTPKWSTPPCTGVAVVGVEPYPVAALAPDMTFESGIVAVVAVEEPDPEDEEEEEEEDPSHAASTLSPARAAPARTSALAARRRR